MATPNATSSPLSPDPNAMTPVTIVDYHAGNVTSLANAFRRAGGQPTLSRSPEDIVAAERIVLPGVGAAGQAMRHLQAEGLVEALGEAVMKRQVPFLGICLGMQLLAERLTEFGEMPGLGWIPGEVVNLADLETKIEEVPHTGWSEIDMLPAWSGAIGGSGGSKYYYFNHSFTLRTDEKLVAATANHGVPLVAAVATNNIFATQFHPEISHRAGRKLLGNFLAWRP